ncbi:hypothetical protein ACVWYQ_003389 [Bradyrhizobium sp. USDA 3397]
MCSQPWIKLAFFASRRRTASIPDAGALVSFETSNICFATGYKVARLERYYVWTNPRSGSLARQYKDYATSKDTCKVTAATATSILANGALRRTQEGTRPFTIRVTAPSSPGQRLLFTFSSCHFGYYFHAWSQPVARYGLLGAKWTSWSRTRRARKEHVCLRQAQGDRVLFSSVNDAVLALPRQYQWLYKDNAGCISFFIKPSKSPLWTDVGTWWAP